MRGPDHKRVLQALWDLAEEPRPAGCEKLYDGVYRIRVGRWRVIYLIDESNQRIEVGGVRRRSEGTYKGIDDLFG